jgi:DNA-binding transcriptional ArsR family regulator
MPETNDHTIDDASALITVLADRTRLRILAALTAGEVSVDALWRRLGISQPLVSFHLHHLREAGLVQRRREGILMYYWIDEEGWDAAIRAINAVFDPETPL